jgi:type IV pilus assembly protein PilQ
MTAHPTIFSPRACAHRPGVAGVGLLVILCAAGPFGCRTVDPEPAAVFESPVEGGERISAEVAELDAMMQRAQRLYEGKRYSSALVTCVDLGHHDPDYPGLRELQKKILRTHLEDRWEEAFSRDDVARDKMALDALESGDVPDTFKAERYVRGETVKFLEDAGPTAQALDSLVTMHLKDADLATLIDALSTDTNFNIIADQNVGEGKLVNVEVDNVPLREILDYIARNMGVEFHVGTSVLWVTTPAEGQSGPLHTRIYRLHKGLQWHGGDWGPLKEGQASTGDLNAIAGKATVLSTNVIYMEEMITKFTVPAEGSQLHIDRNSHTLFVKNTWENLEVIDRIVEALDVNPPQVFIEAHFVETTISDLRELGLDWSLNSPLIASTTTVLQDGQRTDLTRTQIDPGEVVRFDPFTSDDVGPSPLGPQGAFGEVRTGVPATAGQGLNLSYQGILTKPMFTAVLHALDVSGKGRTLSAPRMTTVNNNPAKFRNGEDLRYYEQFTALALTLLDENRKPFQITALIPTGSPSLEELGITLVAVPSVGADLETISLLLIPTLSRLEGFLNYQEVSEEGVLGEDIRRVVVKLPIINRREIQTKVVVRSGDTVVMGGLIDSVQQETVHKVPFLGDIPGLGKLFQRLDVTEESRNLLVFVTATILSESGESLVPLAPARPLQPPML